MGYFLDSKKPKRCGPPITLHSRPPGTIASHKRKELLNPPQPLESRHVSSAIFSPPKLLPYIQCLLASFSLQAHPRSKQEREKEREMVMKEESRGEEAKFGGLARACDSCSVVPSAVFCRADSAYLCMGCDTRVHTANKVASRHERVWMCEVCERAPAALTCKADAAVLCTACDADIHSANPLASSHRRVPILPISGRLFGRGGEEREEEAASWLLLNPRRNQNGGGDGGEFFYGGEVEDYLDLVEYGSCTENHYEQSSQNQQFNNQCQQQQKNDGSDSVVPVQCLEIKDAKENQHDQKFMEMEFEGSMAGHSYTASLSQSLSHSSMDAGIVPDTTMTDISNSHIGSCKVTAEPSTGPPLQIPPQFSSTDRKASVLRYKEKRKNRKFEKRIRYASRKAYAETRPRIKGRFAKRTDVEVEVDQIYSVNAIAEVGYGIVPSF